MMLHCWTRRSLVAVACCAIVAASMGRCGIAARAAASHERSRRDCTRPDGGRLQDAPGAAHQSAVVGQVQRRHVGR